METDGHPDIWEGPAIIIQEQVARNDHPLRNSNHL